METNLYRKYRPQNFNQVVGQQVVVRTLVNSIKNDSIAHAYLFSGVRGTGKTSIAKIFARAINCLNPDNPLCGECEICQEYQTGAEIPDIFEIDAASNNGVEEIRKIIDNVKYMPIRTKYKVYIIDEVHMLSKGAFNALLKTLEEPPTHVIFILATTEPNKIPVTILSRVQRFDFSRIDEGLMLAHLKNVLDKEGVSYQPEALDIIVYHAQGGLRDALSLLTKVISFAPEVTIDTVSECLNLAAKDVAKDTLQAILDNDPEAVSSNFKQLMENGVDEAYLVQDLIRLAKEQMITAIGNGDNTVGKYTRIIKNLMEAATNIKVINNAGLYIEVCLIELAVKLKPQVVVEQPVPVAAPAKPEMSEAERMEAAREQARRYMEEATSQPKQPIEGEAKQEEIVEPQEQAEMIVEAQTMVPNEMPQQVPTPKQVKVQNDDDQVVDIQLDMLFANKTGDDIDSLQSKLQEVKGEPQAIEEAASSDVQPEDFFAPEAVDPVPEVEEQPPVEEVIEAAEYQEQSIIEESIDAEEPQAIEESIGAEEPQVIEESMVEEIEQVEESIASMQYQQPVDEEIVEESIASMQYQQPVVEESIASTVHSEQSKPETVVESTQPQVSLLEVLMSATAEDKNEANVASQKAISVLNRRKDYGLAKFFEISTIQGASDEGLVISIDQDLYVTYEARLEKITTIFSHFMGSQMTIHLVSTEFWKENRRSYVDAVRANQQNDILKAATDFFGKDLVNKIDS